MEEIIKYAVEAGVFLAATYLLFFRKYTEELGKQTAEIHTIAQKTEQAEKVREGFNQNLERFKNELQIQLAKDIEPVKASLNRSNIAFQISSSEFARLRFQRLDTLYGKLYELQKFIKQNLLYYLDDADYQQKRKRFFDLYQQAEDALYMGLLYVEEDTVVSTNALLNECFTAFTGFIQYYNTSPKGQPPPFIFQNPKLVDANIESLNRLHGSIEEFTEHLIRLRSEFRKQLQGNQM